MSTLFWLERRAVRFPKVAILLFSFSFVACFGPGIGVQFQHLRERPHYQFYPTMLPFLLGIGLSRWNEARDIGLPFKSLRVHIPLLLACIVSGAAAIWLFSPWLGFFSAICLLLLLSRNVPLLSSAVWPLLLLLPVPLSMDLELVHGLQRLSSSNASALLDIAAVPHVMAGNVVEVKDRTFFVEESCSGKGSAFLLLASAAVYGVWKELRFVTLFPLLVASVGWAVAANTVRIFLVAWSHVTLNIDLSIGTPHEILGVVTYLVALLMTVLTEILECWSLI